MMKPCRGEKIGLKFELKKVSILVFTFFLSHNLPAYSQVPINGFCKYNSYNLAEGYNSVYPLNFNGDSYTDLVLFNGDLKRIITVEGDKNGGFTTSRAFYTSYEISNIKHIRNYRNKIESYAFASRRKRKAGIMNFTSYGKPYFEKIVSFNSYPENLSVADISHDGNTEILVSGAAFNGLSILSENQNVLNETKLVDDASFSDAIFIDLSNDSYSDIAAFNLNKNSLEFYYNNGGGNFENVRSISLNYQVKHLASFDMNLDSYEDLIFSQGNSFEIMYGDYASSYENCIYVKTKYQPDNFITGDFNKDGKIDIAYINKDESILSVIFGKGENSFYDEILFFKRSGLEDIIPYYSKFLNGVAVLSREGKLFTVTNLSSIMGKVSISLGVEPGAINYFDYENNGMVDICYIDNFTRSLDLLVRNSSGLPVMFYSIPIFSQHSEIYVDNKNADEKVFYCYTTGKKLVEAVTVNFYSQKVSRHSMYASGSIKDFKVLHSEGDLRVAYAAYVDKNNLGINEFRYRDSKIIYLNYPDLERDVQDAGMVTGNSVSLYSWQKRSDSIYVSSLKIGNVPNEYKKLNGFLCKNDSLTFSYTGDLLNKEQPVSIAFIKSDSGKCALLYSGSLSAVIKNSGFTKTISITNRRQLFFGEIKFGGLKKLIVYDAAKNALFKIDFLNKGKNLVATKLIDVTGINSYFIKNMNFRNYHLVYSNKTNGCITIKEL